jgi:anthranilate synthase component 1
VKPWAATAFWAATRCGCSKTWGDRSTQTHRDGTVVEHAGNPFDTLADCLAPYHPVKLPALPPGIGGLFGFWGYELIRWIEPTVPIYPPGERRPARRPVDAGG